MRPEISPERLSELIGAIYDCVITPEKWRATIDAIRLEFDFKGGGFYLCAFPSGSTRLEYTAGIEAAAVDRIASYSSAALVEFWGGPTKSKSVSPGRADHPLAGNR